MQSHFLNLEGPSYYRNFFGLKKTRVSHFLNHFLGEVPELQKKLFGAQNVFWF